MKKGKLAAALMVGSCILLGCYPGGPTFTEDLDMVVTNHDTSFDFQKLGTFALPDRVVKITGKIIEGQEPDFVSDLYAPSILAAVRQNMKSMGWTEVSELSNPDVIILPSAISTTNNIWYYESWYWGWYYPYSYWGWYYPYPIYGGSYTSGSLFVQITYPDGITAADNIPVVWSCVFNGLLEGSTESVNQRITSGVNQAFQQSPYLHQ
jgi:hypothetical protein